ncbi:MAG: caspase family protein [Fimbriimonadaceae bacterium]
MKNLILIAALALSTVSAFAETYTLSIGINDYPTSKDEKGNDVDSDLLGCVNDAKAMQDIYINKFGVKKANTKMLLDKDATGEKFLDGVKWLIANAKVGDQVVFSYSGHGAQLEDPKAADGSGFTEVIVLADETLVQDTLFNEIANFFRINGVNATFIFDSCHSGGMSRDVSGKFKIQNKSLGVVKAKGKMKANMDKVTKGIMQVKPRQATTAKTGEMVFLYASEKNKTSSDISGLEGIPAHGLFTMLLMDLLDSDKSMPIKSVYDLIDEILDEINSKFMKDGKEAKMEESKIPQFTQSPNFEASAARSALPIILPN